MLSSHSVVGRYAPSPTGRLHLGNLRTALFAWLQVRLQGGEFLLRFDDLDEPRVVAGSKEQIMQDLRWLGIDWDGKPYSQTDHIASYKDALGILSEKGLTYPCYCSRKDIQQAASAPHGATGVYPGTCRELTLEEQRLKQKNKQPAIRTQVADKEVNFYDQIQGSQQQSLVKNCGDFVVKRADGLFAYQLAVVIDDIQQGVTDVLRGKDLLDSTARQMSLFDRFDSAAPRYWHVPLVKNDAGERMAKRDGSDSVATWQAQGRDAQELVAHFAKSVAFVDSETYRISPNELLSKLTIESFRRNLQNS